VGWGRGLVLGRDLRASCSCARHRRSGARPAPSPAPRARAWAGGRACEREGGARKRRARGAQLRAWRLTAGAAEPALERCGPERAAETKATVSAAADPMPHPCSPWDRSLKPGTAVPSSAERGPALAAARCGLWVEPAAPFSGLGEVLLPDDPAFAFSSLSSEERSPFSAGGRLRHRLPGWCKIEPQTLRPTRRVRTSRRLEGRVGGRRFRASQVRVGVGTGFPRSEPTSAPTPGPLPAPCHSYRLFLLPAPPRPPLTVVMGDGRGGWRLADVAAAPRSRPGDRRGPHGYPRRRLQPSTATVVASDELCAGTGR
jgi:hypothetical protein